MKHLFESLETRTLLANLTLVQDINRQTSFQTDRWLGTLNGGLLHDSTPYDKGSLFLLKSDGTKTELLKEDTRDIGELAAVAGGNAFFTLRHYTGSVGYWELWKTNGTSAGTIKLKDLGLSAGSEQSIGEMVVAGSKMYLSTYDLNPVDKALWVSDGTVAGTLKLKSFNSDYGASALTPNGNGLFFEAVSGQEEQIWKTDGTVAGTKVVTDGSGQDYGFSRFDAVAWNNGVIYIGDGTFQTDDYPWDNYLIDGLFYNNGSQKASTTFIDPDYGNQPIQGVSQLTRAGSNIYFNATIGGLTGLWTMSSPTQGNWKRVTPWVDSNSIRFETFKDKLVISGYDGVYTVSGTTSSKLATANQPYSFTNATTRAFFFSGDNLWTTDGTAAGTKKIKTITGIGGSDPYNSFVDTEPTSSGAIYFPFNGDVWYSDGTNTKVVGKIGGANQGSAPSSVVSFKGSAYFVASNVTAGTEIWKTNTAGTSASLLIDLAAGVNGSNPGQLTPAGDRMFFFATLPGSNGKQLYVTDGTSAGTKLVSTPSLAVDNAWLFPQGNSVYFSANDGTHGYELWKTDGTVAGTKMIKDIAPGWVSSTPLHPALFKNVLYFSAGNDANTGNVELWKTDGTTTSRVADINVGTGGSNPENLTACGNYLYFTADDGKSGRELWKTAGSGATMVKNLNTVSTGFDRGTDFSELADMNGTLYFSGVNQSTRTRGTYKTDGTGNGTVLLVGAWSHDFHYVNGRAYFFGTADPYSYYDNDLYQSAGTSATTKLLIPTIGDLLLTSLEGITVVGSTLYLSGRESEYNHGVLWRSNSDQTAWTALTGTEFMEAGPVTDVNGTLYSAADDGVHGVELYRVVGLPGSVTGTLFDDKDSDGIKDTGEAALTNIRVWIDSNKDGVWQTTEKDVVTTSTGKYSFTSLTPGSYTLRSATVAGKRYTTSNPRTITIATGATTTANIGLTSNVLISGRVFADIDKDKLFDSTEKGLSAWRVYIDKDNDGIFDSGETSVLTDANGLFSFKTLAAGTYHVRVVGQAGYTRITPTTSDALVTLTAGQSKTTLLFGYSK